VTNGKLDTFGDVTFIHPAKLTAGCGANLDMGTALPSDF
tara:strand:- start:90 stop:206 length:117 start_codon:yes stop_codon:yes gene_type:complete